MSDVNSEAPVNSQVPFESDASQHSSPPTNAPMNSPSPLSNQHVIDLEESNTTCGGTKRKSSVVWEHFKKQQVNGVWKAICNYCNKHLGGDSKNGTRHLHDHHKSCTRKKVMDMRQKVLTNNFNREIPKMNSYIFDQDFARKELSHAIILHEYPLSIVDHVGFKRYSAALQPLFKVPSRNTIKSDILKIYDYERVKTLSLVEHNKSRVAITTDMWTASNQKKGFMAVTAHFIDDSWTLQSRILRFIYVPCPHTKEVLCDTLLECEKGL
ncbi:zinc finger BED domain-containing protein RICESLEEPER 3-like [Camellia sinensis]|uniref:zinc finger BED domain-containing protein RICESLEEPER 3-like n=1 Tax=Camellia sinensis TaxID=4442 RepID=UPI001035983C|nr:zinc finger BED domain-containing protein RICESLEEPER 3-like [Camellia sinensis]